MQTTKKLKIAVYTMAKNEATHVERFCRSVEGADYVVVTDTGSTDGTQELLADRGVLVHTASIQPWRFDTATNVALANVPADADVCIKLDLDEVLYTPNGQWWRDCIERVWENGVSQLSYKYTWSWLVPGVVPDVQFAAMHIHARNGYIWRHAGHACLEHMFKNSKSAHLNGMEIHHYMVSKGRPDYLPLLELAAAENECPRTLFYLGREYIQQKDDAGILKLQQYLQHPKSTWQAERAEAMRLIGQRFAAIQSDAAISWFMQAAAAFPRAREPYFSLAKYLAAQKDWLGAVWAGQRCLMITARDLQYVTSDSGAWGPAIYQLLAEGYKELQNRTLLLRVLEAGLLLFPTDELLQQLAIQTGGFEVCNA